MIFNSQVQNRKKNWEFTGVSFLAVFFEVVDDVMVLSRNDLSGSFCPVLSDMTNSVIPFVFCLQSRRILLY